MWFGKLNRPRINLTEGEPDRNYAMRPVLKTRDSLEFGTVREGAIRACRINSAIRGHKWVENRILRSGLEKVKTYWEEIADNND